MLPKDIFNEYEKGVQYKTAIGGRGMFEQNKLNERFTPGINGTGLGAARTGHLSVTMLSAVSATTRFP